MMIQVYEEKLLNRIDEMVNTATDDELFASGYLRGHISIAAADCEKEGIHCINVMKERVEMSLKAAANELNPVDQVLVNRVWYDLQQ